MTQSHSWLSWAVLALCALLLTQGTARAQDSDEAPEPVTDGAPADTDESASPKDEEPDDEDEDTAEDAENTAENDGDPSEDPGEDGTGPDEDPPDSDEDGDDPAEAGGPATEAGEEPVSTGDDPPEANGDAAGESGRDDLDEKGDPAAGAGEVDDGSDDDGDASARPDDGAAPNGGGSDEDSDPSDALAAELGGNVGGCSSGGTIESIDLVCNVAFCDDLENVERLERITGLWPGQELSVEQVERARNRLVQTGYFAKVDAFCRVGVSGAVVRFETIGQVMIRDVDFEETGDIFESDLRKRMFLRSGRPLSPRPVRLARLSANERAALTLDSLQTLAVEDQVASLQRLYQREGFENAQVTVSVEPAGPYLVDVVVDVVPGKAFGLGKVYIRGHESFTYDQIERELRGAFGFFSNFTESQLNEGVEDVTTMYRRAGWIEVRVRKDFRKIDDGRRTAFDVYLDIRENRRWEIEFEGNLALDDEELTDALTFYEAGFIDPAEIASSVAEIEARYETAGHYWARIRTDTLYDGPDGTGRLTFLIDEGPRSEIDAIVFEGATALPPEVLSEAIQSRPFQAFGSGAFPQRELIANDANLIIEAYQRVGYLTADVPRWHLEPLGEDPTKLTLTFEIVEGPLTTVRTTSVRAPEQEMILGSSEQLVAAPGRPFNVLDVARDIAAMRRPLTEDGYARVEVRAACTFYRAGDAVEMGRDRGGAAQASAADDLPGSEATVNPGIAPDTTTAMDAIAATLSACAPPQLPPACLPAEPEELCEEVPLPDGGYREVCRRTYAQAGNEPGGAACDRTPRESDAVDIVYDANPGQKHFVGEFFLHGNFVTANWVVKQDFPFDTGDPLDLDGLLRARGQLRSRRIYNSVVVNTIGLEDASSEYALSAVPIVVYVEEGTRRELRGAVGVSLIAAELLFDGELEFIEANLFGTGTELSIAFLPTFRIFSDAGEFVLDNDVDDSFFRIFANFNQDWFTVLTLRVPIAPISGIDLLVQAFYDLRYIADPQREEQGAVAEIRWNISRAWFLSVALEGKLSALREVDEDATIQDFDICAPVAWFQDCGFGERLQTYSVLPRVIYDARDSPLNPTDGYVFDMRTKFAFTEEVGVFIRPDIRGTRYWTFLRNFTLALNGRIGFAMLLESSEALSEFERFYLGGINMRGFELDAVGPRARDPDEPGVLTNDPAGGETLLNANVELRIPILKETGLYGVIFVDTGSLLVEQFLDYPDAGEFFMDLFWTQLRITSGIGIRFLIAENLPPLVLDYGLILNRRPGEPFGASHFNVGYTF